MKCRHCNAEVTLPLINLESAPPSNAYLTKISMRRPEKWFPLKVLVCESCWLVQAEAYSRAAELFNEEYAYFSSFSDIWLSHAKVYVEKMVHRFHLDSQSHVLEVAANDGYLLQYVKAKNIPCTGIEPTSSTATAARAKGIPIIEDFLTARLAKNLADEGKSADLMTANNVLAHVPDINDFVASFCILLKETGVATFEFPHVMRLVEDHQFDTIYHEHFSYLSFTTIHEIFSGNGLKVFDVEELKTHGGSLRVYAQRTETGIYPVEQTVGALLKKESAAGMQSVTYYKDFQKNADKVKNDFLKFLVDAKLQNKLVVAYGAAAKGNTLLNYAGVKPDLIRYVVDRNPAKQGKWMPGSRIPIILEGRLKIDKPDYIIILPWNIKMEVINQLDYVKDWGCQFVTAVPKLEIV